MFTRAVALFTFACAGVHLFGAEGYRHTPNVRHSFTVEKGARLAFDFDHAVANADAGYYLAGEWFPEGVFCSECNDNEPLAIDVAPNGDVFLFSNGILQRFGPRGRFSALRRVWPDDIYT